MSDTISRMSSELNSEHDAVMFSLECGSVRELKALWRLWSNERQCGLGDIIKDGVALVIG